ncbi:hypothetical protein JGU71_06885 [Antrihabitans sp. YC3-6]|uniref:Uncharacterized protein n=1 Tax=Antrihabitans stalagmiti TaxID=2799499 RepID=A0A934NNS1_9NOCA|nr:hypothetical protein [Antrihabitans stalagmiti]
MSHQIARELAAVGPAGWERLDAVFALTTTGEVVQVFYTVDGASVRVNPPATALAAARQHRDVSSKLGDGPWWRMLLELTNTGAIKVEYDYGDEPFPEDQLFTPETYLADLQQYPRRRLPVWLAAYVGHQGRQLRTPQQAAEQARADRAANVHGVVSVDDFPAFPQMWARWATISAAFVAIRSEWGPRVLPSLGWFEGKDRTGSTLYVLPGGRAVISGGVWDPPALDATYNDGAPMPKFYAGAPDWIANPVLNTRAGNGLLSFCYWWDGGRWYRGESPPAKDFPSAVPGVWTADLVNDIVARLISADPSPELKGAVANLLSAAEAGVVTRGTLTNVFREDEFDVDGAMYQLSIAGVVAVLPEPLSQADAITRVRTFILNSGMDTSNYPLEQLRAQRITVGWMVYVPTRPDEISIGRAIFYIADDGHIERSSSSVAPSVFAAGFEQRYQQRIGSRE